MRIKLRIFILLLFCQTVFAGTFYIASTGVDTNNGTATNTPWLHAPGMPNCVNTCAGHTPVAGDRFIFRGGDTWHFGNSGASPYVGGLWNWTWNGTSGNVIYIGVDQTFFNAGVCGASWCRPLMNGDNALSTSTTLSSCSFQVSGNNDFFSIQLISFVTVDNFEFLGLCQSSTNAPFGHDIYISDGSANHVIFQNLYFHGWTHVQFSCVVGPVGNCFNATIFEGGQGSGLQTGTTYQNIVVDGSDSDPGGAQVFFDGMYDVHNSVFTHASQMIGSLCHLFYGNLIDNWLDPGDGEAHGNTYECVGEATGTNAIYNNVVRHIYNTGIQGVNFWPEPSVGTTDYIFNNLMYDVNAGGNYFNIGQNGFDQGPLVFFNNTFENPLNGTMFGCSSGNSHTFTAANNHYITDSGSQYSNPCTGGTFVTELLMTHATATAQGYTAAETYAYSPISAGNSTPAHGTNEQTFCTALNTAAGSDATLVDAASACLSDTKYACSYNSSNHTVSCPVRTVITRPTSAVWDIGAYQFLSQPSPSAPSVGMFSWIWDSTGWLLENTRYY